MAWVFACSNANQGGAAAIGGGVALAMLGTGMRPVTVGLPGLVRTPRPGLSRVRANPGEQTQFPERPLMLAVATWTVALSVYAHGLTAWPGADRYADWYAPTAATIP